MKNRRSMVLLLIVLLALAMTGAAYAEQEPEDVSMTVDLACGVGLQLPAGELEHVQKVHFTPITEVFSMKVGERTVPLYRIDFGDEDAGSWLGMLQTEDGDIPVTYELFVMPEEELAALDEETVAEYYSMMEDFNLVLEAITGDPRFTEDRESLGEAQEAVLKHWTLTLPGKITWTETEENGAYQAVFYGRIQGEDVVLYTVSIGGESADVLGMYTIDGEDKAVSVSVHAPEGYVYWTEADYNVAYQLMDTVNDVIQAITENASFHGE